MFYGHVIVGRVLCSLLWLRIWRARIVVAIYYIHLFGTWNTFLTRGGGRREFFPEIGGIQMRVE